MRTAGVATGVTGIYVGSNYLPETIPYPVDISRYKPLLETFGVNTEGIDIKDAAAGAFGLITLGMIGVDPIK